MLQVWGRWAQVFPANWTFGLESAFFERRERSATPATDEDVDEEALRRDARIAGLYDGAAPSELKASLARLRYYIRHRTIGLPPSEAYREAAREHDARVASMAGPAPGPPESDDEDVDGEAGDDVDELADVAAPAFAPGRRASVAPVPAAVPAFARSPSLLFLLPRWCRRRRRRCGRATLRAPPPPTQSAAGRPRAPPRSVSPRSRSAGGRGRAASLFFASRPGPAAADYRRRRHLSALISVHSLSWPAT